MRAFPALRVWEGVAEPGAGLGVAQHAEALAGTR